MSEIEINVNGRTETIPRTVQTERDILRAIDYDPAYYALYRDTGGEIDASDRAGAYEDDHYNAPPVVVSDGDSFVVIPKQCNGG